MRQSETETDRERQRPADRERQRPTERDRERLAESFWLSVSRVLRCPVGWCHLEGDSDIRQTAGVDLLNQHCSFGKKVCNGFFHHAILKVLDFCKCPNSHSIVAGVCRNCFCFPEEGKKITPLI